MTIGASWQCSSIFGQPRKAIRLAWALTPSPELCDREAIGIEPAIGVLHGVVQSTTDASTGSASKAGERRQTRLRRRRACRDRGDAVVRPTPSGTGSHGGVSFAFVMQRDTIDPREPLDVVFEMMNDTDARVLLGDTLRP
jgi:hypothetical protein